MRCLEDLSLKEHGPDIPLESLKAMKHTYDNYHTEKDVALGFSMQ